MLVLSRKPGEEIVIGADLRITVVAIRGNQVRLGFTAPAGTLIRRLELCQSADWAPGRKPPMPREKPCE
jgi:carbon storage regulator